MSEIAIGDKINIDWGRDNRFAAPNLLVNGHEQPIRSLSFTGHATDWLPIVVITLYRRPSMDTVEFAGPFYIESSDGNGLHGMFVSESERGSLDEVIVEKWKPTLEPA